MTHFISYSNTAIIGAVGCCLFNLYNQKEAWIRIPVILIFMIMRLIKINF